MGFLSMDLSELVWSALLWPAACELGLMVSLGWLADASDPEVELCGEPAPDACASANAVLSANTNTDVCRYFFMPVSPRLMDRLLL